MNHLDAEPRLMTHAWPRLPLKRFIRSIESGVSVNAIDLPAQEGERGVLKTSSVYSGTFDPSENKRVLEDELERLACPVREDTLIVSRMNTPDLVGAAAAVRKPAPGIYLPDRLWQVDFEGLSTRFVDYWTKTELYRSQVRAACAGTSASMQNLSQEDFGGFVIWQPPREWQQDAVRFLDRETARINALIEKKTRFIGLLREKRQALITQAVTQGLDPSVPMKDSGVEWLGRVPAHWAVLSFQRVVFIAEGQVDPELEPYRSMLLIAPNHVEGGTGRLIARETAAEQAAESGKYQCDAGDVVYSKIRPALRKACIAPEPCLCSADMYPLRGIGGMTNPFLLWFLLSEPFSAFAVLEADRVAMPKINRDSLSRLKVPLPPPSEQAEICAKVQSVTSLIDRLIDQTNASIALLRERRSALITAAVTGQIDLREAA